MILVLCSALKLKKSKAYKRLILVCRMSTIYSTTFATYMRWFKNGSVHRVAKLLPDGLSLALYPTKDRDIFSGEVFRNIDDISPKSRVPRKEITDEVLMRLLDGKSIDSILDHYYEKHVPISFEIMSDEQEN